MRRRREKCEQVWNRGKREKEKGKDALPNNIKWKAN